MTYTHNKTKQKIQTKQAKNKQTNKKENDQALKSTQI